MYKHLLFLLGIFLCGLTGVAQTELTVELGNLANEKEAEFYEIQPDQKPKLIQKATVKEGKIQVALSRAENQSLVSLKLKDLSGEVFFIREDRPTLIKVSVINLDGKLGLNTSNVVIEGGPANELYLAFLKHNKQQDERFIQLSAKYPVGNADYRTSQKQREELNRVYTDHMSYLKRKILAHPDLLPSLFMFEEILNEDILSLLEKVEIFESLDESVKSTPLGEKLATRLSHYKATSIGGKAENFSAQTPDGEIFSLEEALAKGGEYLLVEFWASWCPHCQREIPFVAELYKKYHEKGLSVLAVSADFKKDEWVQAIEEYGLVWDNISNLKRMEDPIMKLYEVTSIPNNYLLDNNGRIVTKNINGEDLKEKLEELFGF